MYQLFNCTCIVTVSFYINESYFLHFTYDQWSIYKVSFLDYLYSLRRERERERLKGIDRDV